jgi:glycosyltransferase involved in cell wall biosynthesis
MNSKNKTRVCLILAAPLPGGTEKLVINVANNLNRDEFLVTLICFHLIGEFVPLISSDVTVIDLKMNLKQRNPFIHLHRAFQLAGHLKALKIDLVFSSGYYVNFICCFLKLFKMLQMPLIIRETSLWITRFKKALGDRLLLFIFKRFYPVADFFLTPSQAVLDDFKNTLNMPAEKCGVIQNFIDTKLIDRSLQFHIAENLPVKKRPVILSIGRLEEVKGYECALRAVKEVTKEVPCDYWIAGKGPLMKDLQNLAEKLGMAQNVFFLGFQENPYQLLKQADLFLMTSTAEGFPNSVLEAMYFQVPCVVTKFNDSIDQMLENGRAGIVVNSREPDVIGKAIKNVLLSPELSQEISSQASQKVQQYKSDVVIKLYEQLFRSIIKTAR